MNRTQLVGRVRSLTRDLSNSIFREVDIIDYINEAIERMMQYIPEFQDMLILEHNTQIPEYLPKQYHHLLSVYGASRCFHQDNQHYQATTLMNEFEQKLDELRTAIEDGSVVIRDRNGNPVEDNNPPTYVVDAYFNI